MFAGGLVLATTLLSFAVWLQWNERLGWPGESYQEDDDQEYLTIRFRSRRRIHWIIGLCGVLILVATLAGPDSTRVWIGSWSIVMIALSTVVLLAMLDALRTHRHHRHKLPEIRSRLLGDDHGQDPTGDPKN